MRIEQIRRSVSSWSPTKFEFSPESSSLAIKKLYNKTDLYPKRLKYENFS